MKLSTSLSIASVLALTFLAATPVVADSGTTAFDKAMTPVLERYLKIHSALSSDSMKGVPAEAKALELAAKKLDAKNAKGEHAKHYQALPKKIQEAARKFAGIKNIEEARAAFSDLSKPMAMWATMSKPKAIDVVSCSKAKASWLQKKGAIRNPYYGASMLSCGQVENR